METSSGKRPCAPPRLCCGVAAAAVGSWKEREQQPLFGGVLALAYGSFSDLCGASFPYFREGKASVRGSGDADSSYSEKREGRFVQHSTYVICAIEKGLGKHWLFSILQIELYNGVRMLNYSDVSARFAEDIIRLKPL